MKTILVTGGAGYIGSHTCLELLNAGYDVVVVDNLSNSSRESLHRVRKLTGRAIEFYQVDLLNMPALNQVFESHAIDAVIHFAARKAVGESVEKPLAYYTNNVTGTLNLCTVMQQHDVKTLVFSSSATVYGETNEAPLVEKMPLSATNPYGWSKFMNEQILRDLYGADSSWHIALLRYFNPVGAHESGEIGEDPNGIPNNLFPYITQVAIGRRKKLQVYGDNHTPDGTGVRDYIHVVDLAVGHVMALSKLSEGPGLHTWNLGSGRGYSVLEVIAAFEEASSQQVPYEIVGRRPGDLAISYADVSLAKEELGYVAERDIHKMCEDAWRWQSKNPKGYEN